MTSTMDASVRRFDAVLVLNIANGFWFPALRAARTPFAVNTDGIEWERGKWSALGRATFRAGARMTARHADALVCDSQAIAEVWRSLFHRESQLHSVRGAGPRGCWLQPARAAWPLRTSPMSSSSRDSSPRTMSS